MRLGLRTRGGRGTRRAERRTVNGIALATRCQLGYARARWAVLATCQRRWQRIPRLAISYPRPRPDWTGTFVIPAYTYPFVARFVAGFPLRLPASAPPRPGPAYGRYRRCVTSSIRIDPTPQFAYRAATTSAPFPRAPTQYNINNFEISRQAIYAVRGSYVRRPAVRAGTSAAGTRTRRVRAIVLVEMKDLVVKWLLALTSTHRCPPERKDG